MTQAELIKGKSPFPNFFAYGIQNTSAQDALHLVGSNESGFSYQSGIPSSYSRLNGKKVCRGDMNGLGRMISQSKVFNQFGGYYTFNQEVSDAIGGYPQGAILYYKDTETGRIRLVRSLVQDNTYNFVEDSTLINGIYWDYADLHIPTSFRPKIFPAGNSTSVTFVTEQEQQFFKDGLLVIQSGIKGSKDGASNGLDSESFFIEVKKAGQETFFTAGMVGFLPSLRTCWCQGTYSDAIYDSIEGLSESGYTALLSTSPIQVYLSAGDTAKITSSNNTSISLDAAFYPLTA